MYDKILKIAKQFEKMAQSVDYTEITRNRIKFNIRTSGYDYPHIKGVIFYQEFVPNTLEKELKHAIEHNILSYREAKFVKVLARKNSPRKNS